LVGQFAVGQGTGVQLKFDEELKSDLRVYKRFYPAASAQALPRLPNFVVRLPIPMTSSISSALSAKTEPSVTLPVTASLGPNC